MEVKASLNNLRVSPRKARLVAGLLKGMNFKDAESQLRFMVKKTSGPVSKLLSSAAANAVNNFNLVRDNLYIKSIRVDEGRKLKRFKPKGFGRVMPIQKKTSHIIVVLDERTPGLREQGATRTKEIKDTVKRSVGMSTEKDVAQNEKEVSEIKEEKTTKKTETKEKDYGKDISRELGKKNMFKGIKNKLFRRKSI
ncbi:MAG: 50S ribosomal protein L22 [Candidatus Yanofskybacteria bacterium CG10_big_fil_rev_8_21_14_0_10_36_16]|uniref:Large ribosomal subunit protein uL22 n=1 Tax=Candidatus Yanofskybacteria bacterium CG10_big_fil_rev_8_21_14_0_10_36_16 TaxID=1975096 RepID=A0A2J0Q877_9BACT|nr:MAG: 50S ribosomal protein L22 [Candidatus Yanofskybacteria bacterium CG10_big_fil_rev_8_21_14_0_10_36_16]